MANLNWVIGDGTNIEVTGQPWYPEWNGDRQVQGTNPGLKVSEVYNHQDKQWRAEMITQKLGHEALQRIQLSVRHPVQQPLVSDRLVWLGSKKGVYSVKEGYRKLATARQFQPVHNEKQKKAFRIIWKWNNLVPRVRLFLWRALQNGLTTLQEIARRIRTVSPRCPRCNSENEYTMHLLFFCPVSRATWFASQFALRIEGLPLVFEEALLMITSNLEAEEIPFFCNTMWMLWKARNEELFASKIANPSDIIRRTRRMKVDVPKKQGMNRDPDSLLVPPRSRVILVDGSWDNKNRAGIGMGVYNRRGDLVYTRYEKIVAQDPFHTEAQAMLQAVRYAMEEGNDGPFICFSDSKNLVQAIQEGKIEGLPSWRATKTVQECINLRLSRPGHLEIQHIIREAVRTPHEMANWARVTGRCDKGMPVQCGIGHLNIEHNLNSSYFTVQTGGRERTREISGSLPRN